MGDPRIPAFPDRLHIRVADWKDSVFVKDDQGTYLYINPAGAGLLDRAVDDVVGRRDVELFGEATLREEVRASDSETLRTGRTCLYVNTTRVPGVTRTFLSVKFPVEPNGRRIGCLSRDITESLNRPPAHRRRVLERLMRDARLLMGILGTHTDIDPQGRQVAMTGLDLARELPRRILLVDDDPLVRGMIAIVLKTAGYETVEAANGREAWEKIEEEGESIDGLVSDIRMPEMDGRQLASRMRERWPEMPILLLSGYDATGLTDRELAQPRFRFLQKPCRPEELVRILESLLGPEPEVRARPV